MQRGVILLGHGSRQPAANQEIRLIAEQVKKMGEQTDTIYETGFLQFGEPTLPQAIAELVARGVKNITIVPVLLTVGTHIQFELPKLIQEQQGQYPEVSFRLAPHLGADPRIAEILLDRIKQGSE
ncbi:sirohydrochlorin chelatase [Desulforamulus ferrireducens]|uniref:Cobalamin biosynthesis protein CbiX n=1 Tax=Desulforamulus ferrireducens TaxID=1833852 RepID=A0A1S6IZ72_9FIRM|nr:CbiX/SirB N-terminal domain-containing protein [Desulforamulus ferrireducens]AQS60072.1 cobalamin biosynthesis protein CbiX [Desulforamulus ferrireducens]